MNQSFFVWVYPAVAQHAYMTYVFWDILQKPCGLDSAHRDMVTRTGRWWFRALSWQGRKPSAAGGKRAIGRCLCHTSVTCDNWKKTSKSKGVGPFSFATYLARRICLFLGLECIKMPLILPFIINCLDKLARVDLHFEGLQSLKRWITGQDGDSAWWRNQYLNAKMDWRDNKWWYDIHYE